MYIIICHMQMKIGLRLIHQNSTADSLHMKENECVSDMFTLCMWFLVVLDGIEFKVLSCSTNQYKFR